jgi:hypothetical protein
MSVKKYYAWLQYFYENKIEIINKYIVDNRNNSVFDNSDETQMKKVHELEEAINNIFDYIKENYPQFSDYIIDSYYKLKKYYQDEYKKALNNSKKRFNNWIGLPYEPVLSLYPDIHSLINCYINNLEIFYTFCCKDIKSFQEKDIKIRKIFKEGYEKITDSGVIETIKRAENYYDTAICEIMKNSSHLNKLEIIQDSMDSVCKTILEIAKKEEDNCSFNKAIMGMTLNTPKEDILNLVNYAEKNGILSEELYNNLYVIVEKEKYLLLKYNEEAKLYNSLSQKVKIKLEKMFLERIHDYSEIETTEIIDRLKKYGYLKVLDKKYQIFFDEHIFSNRIDFNLKKRSIRHINIKVNIMVMDIMIMEQK